MSPEKVLSVVLLAVVVAADYKAAQFDYHTNIGIPLATKLQNAGTFIAKGTPATAAEQPYLVGVVVELAYGFISICGASMLSHTRSVTAAHCWNTTKYQADRFILAFGTDNVFSGGTRLTTSDVTLHPEYDMNTLKNDVAIIRHDSVDYSETIQPITLPNGDLLQNDFADEWAKTAGFGATSEDPLATINTMKYEATLQVITNEVCIESYGSIVITDSMLCVATAGGHSPCFGDSGGPLAITNDEKDTLVSIANADIGITLFGALDGCDQGIPYVFARVTSFVAWIEENL